MDTSGVPESCAVVVFAPAPGLTVTVEQRDERDELHVHAGGQGFWIARLLRTLGVDTTLCGSYGGETGQVVRALVDDAGLRQVAVTVDAVNGGYVHDRRGGERREVAEQPPTPLSRHDLDDFYSAMLSAGLGARVCVLGGPDLDAPPVPASMYGRLCHDLRAGGVAVVADLSGEPRDAVLAADAGVEVFKTSHEDLVADGLLDPGPGLTDVVAVMHRLAETGGGARHVVVTRAEEPALALSDGEVFGASGPHVEPLDPRGAGDSVTAGIAAGLARGEPFLEALRLGVAAATLNVTRHGLASGNTDAITAMAARVEIEPIELSGAAP